MASIHYNDRYRLPYRVHWRENGRQATPKGFRTKAEAAAFAHRIEMNAALGIPLDPQGAKVEFVTYARAWIDRHHDPVTARNYYSVLRRHIAPWAGTRTLADVAMDRAAADDLLNVRMTGKDGRLMSRNYRGAARLILLRTVTEAVNRGDLVTHRLADVELARSPERPPKLLDRLTDEQITRFAAEMDKRHGWGLAVRCLYGLGLRVSEVRGLERSDFSADLRTLRLTEQATRDGKGRKALKTASSVRVIPVPAGLRPLIKAHGRGPLVPGTNGTRYPSDSTFYHWARKAAEAVGIKGWHPHSARGQYSVTLLDSGRPAHRVAPLLGHTSAATTLKYYARLTGKAEDDPEVDRLFGGWAATGVTWNNGPRGRVELPSGQGN